MEFSEIDILQIEEKGLTTKEVERQLQIFERGNIKVDIEEAATVGNGIFTYDEVKEKAFIEKFEAEKDKLEVLKFVPASGAATRMFKALHNFVTEFSLKKDNLQDYLDRTNDSSLQHFFEKMENLPFYKKAKQQAEKYDSDFSVKSTDEQKLELVKIMLYEDGLNLSNLPKGLVPFHAYSNYTATAFEEHLHSAARYIAVNGLAKLHFTVAEKDREKFETEFKAIKDRVQRDTKTHFEITYSFQDPKTDTIAATKENKAFRDEDNKLFFRPGGHGALIDNLNKQKADLIFIKNIDNVVVSAVRPKMVEMKKMLGGKLLELQAQIFKYLEKLESNTISEADLDEIAKYLEEELFVRGLDVFKSLSKTDKIKLLQEKLNRPLRVCGMVKNEGEAGGGPFLVKDDKGEVSLQIIEGAQIDKENEKQLELLNNSTHFNPVDIVCGTRDYNGDYFQLDDFVNEKMSFIANKTKDGKALKALERPGLWNGGMAYWNTVFVEVPVETFNPVKTVADLLKPSHQVDK